MLRKISMLVKSCNVVGGGLGGLTLARALTRKGVAVRVFDQAARFEPTAGAGFGFSPNGQICLAALGLEKETRGIGHDILNHTFYDYKFQTKLFEGGSFGLIKKKYGYALGCTMRRDLVNILLDSLPPDTVRYRSKVVCIDENTGTVELQDGSKYEADMIVGADGIHSKVLDCLGWDEDPIYSKVNIFYGIIEDRTVLERDVGRPIPELGEKNRLIVNQGANGEFLCFPCGNENAYVWAMTYRADEPPKGVAEGEEWVEGAKKSLENVMGKFPTIFTDKHPLRYLSGKTDRLMHFGLFSRAAQSRWHRNKVCLLGDSAHATLPFVGQGANQAIEDAVVLAQELETAPNLEEAYSNYFKRRFKRTKDVVELANKMCYFYHFAGRSVLGDSAIRFVLRDKLLQFLMQSGLFFKIAEKEILENSPIMPRILDKTIKL